MGIHKDTNTGIDIAIETKNEELRPKFWQRFALADLTQPEWEALCDGCGGCCLEKFLEDPERPEEVEYTNVACRLLDCDTGFCSDYANRHHYVPDCISLTADKLPLMLWLPSNCAYKRLYLGQPLPEWHLLNTNDRNLTQQGMYADGVGVAGRCVSETAVDEDYVEMHIVKWVHA